MNEPSPRIAAGLLGLVALWIGVYWWWPSSSQPKGITFSQGVVEPDRAPSQEAATQSKTQEAPTLTPESTKQNTTEPSPSQTPSVIPPQFQEHTVAPGETYAAISIKYFGTSAYANAVAKANPLMSPTSLRPGRVIKVPKDPRNVQGIPARTATSPGSGLSTEYIVEPGDTLSRIAKKFYGDSSLATVIYNANRAVLADEDSLRVGQKLMLPPKPKPE